MKFYVAGRFSNKDKVRKINKLLLEKGHQLSGDWTSHEQVKPYDKEPSRSMTYSIEDMNAIVNCDIFILLINKEAGIGSSTELGAAIALNIKSGKPKIYIAGKNISNNMFNFHPSVEVKETIYEVVESLD